MPRTSKQEHTELSIEADSPVPLYQRVKTADFTEDL